MLKPYFAIYMILMTNFALAEGWIVAPNGRIAVLPLGDPGTFALKECPASSTALENCFDFRKSALDIEDARRTARLQKRYSYMIGGGQALLFMAVPIVWIYSASGTGASAVGIAVGGLDGLANLVVGAPIAGAAGIGLATVIHFVDPLNPVKRWQNADALALITAASEGKIIEVDDINQFKINLSKGMDYLPYR